MCTLGYCEISKEMRVQQGISTSQGREAHINQYSYEVEGEDKLVLAISIKLTYFLSFELEIYVFNIDYSETQV